MVIFGQYGERYLAGKVSEETRLAVPRTATKRGAHSGAPQAIATFRYLEGALEVDVLGVLEPGGYVALDAVSGCGVPELLGHHVEVRGDDVFYHR